MSAKKSKRGTVFATNPNEKDMTEKAKTVCAFRGVFSTLLYGDYDSSLKGHCFCPLLTFYLSVPSITVVTSAVEAVCVCLQNRRHTVESWVVPIDCVPPSLLRPCVPSLLNAECTHLYLIPQQPQNNMSSLHSH